MILKDILYNASYVWPKANGFSKPVSLDQISVTLLVQQLYPKLLYVARAQCAKHLKCEDIAYKISASTINNYLLNDYEYDASEIGHLVQSIEEVINGRSGSV
jgi:hypothetical protein